MQNAKNFWSYRGQSGDFWKVHPGISFPLLLYKNFWEMHAWVKWLSKRCKTATWTNRQNWTVVSDGFSKRKQSIDLRSIQSAPVSMRKYTMTREAIPLRASCRRVISLCVVSCQSAVLRTSWLCSSRIVERISLILASYVSSYNKNDHRC